MLLPPPGLRTLNPNFLGVLRGPDGSPTEPSFAFTSDPTTGMYQIGTRNIGFTAGGALAVSLLSVNAAVNFPQLVASATGNAVQLRAAGSDANISLVLSAKGTGGISAQLPDSAITGGNARGPNAVDWQQARIAATQVASGTNSTVGGGQNNTATGALSTVGGGNTNNAGGNSSTIAGGANNIVAGIAAAIGGGNTNNASGLQSTISGGRDNLASGVNSWVPGGQFGTTRGAAGRGAWAATRIASTGDAQCGEHHLLRQSTSATPVRLTADNAVTNTTNIINLPNFAAYSGVLTVVSKATGSADAATWRVNVSAVRGNGAGTTALYEGAGTALVPTASNGTGSAWRLDIAADTVAGGIAVTVTGAAATTINHSARFANVEATTVS